MSEMDLDSLDVKIEVDCHGESCPGPVLKTMDALGRIEAGEVVVLKTDVRAAADNVKVAVETGGLAEALGLIEESGGFSLYLKRI